MPDPRSAEVHKVESLQRLHQRLVVYSGELASTADELQHSVRRIEQIFADHRPAYWDQQIKQAERQFEEARERLARMQSVGRPGDRPAATDATKQVQKWKARLQLCQDKRRRCKSVALKIHHAANELLGPIADVRHHGESVLPSAAIQLKGLIDELQRYLQN